MRLTGRFAFCGLAVLAAVGCGSESNHTPDGGCHSDGQRTLRVVGDPNLTVYPGDQAELQVILLEKCVGGVADQDISFEIMWMGEPRDSSLDSPAATTQGSGLAAVNLTGGAQIGQFQVRAFHPDDPAGVFFSINLKNVAHQLYPVGYTNRECWTDGTIELEVLCLDMDTNSPVRGVDVRYTIVPPPPGDASLPDPEAVTNLSGSCSSDFHGGSLPTSYKVVAEGADREVGKVTFDIIVWERQSCVTDDDCPSGFRCVNGGCHQVTGDECVGDGDCPQGYECLAGFCRPEGVLPDACASSDDCPPGYFCENQECTPCPEESPLDECVIEGDDCIEDSDCPAAFFCLDGICYPDEPDPINTPEIGGTWYTRHYFDISNAMGSLSSLDGILSILTQAINYCHVTGIDFVDDLICDLIDEFVPEWAGTLIDIFANLAFMLNEIRVEGVMQISHLNPRYLVSGSEVFESILIRYPNACCEGQPDSCNPFQHPDFPDCATIDITMDDLDYGDVGIEVLPFTGKIQVDLTQAPPVYTLFVDPRQVRMEFSRFVALLVDLLVEIFLGYDGLDEALQDLIDCAAIQDVVDDVLGSGIVDAEAACEAVKPLAGPLLSALLDEIGIGWKVLKFSGVATIATEDDPPYGVLLGLPGHEQSRDGSWDGDVTIVLEGSLSGSWYAER